MKTFRQLLSETESALDFAKIDNASFEALQLLLYSCGMDRTEYLLYRDRPAQPENIDTLSVLVRRRIEGEPLQYLLQSQDFLENTFTVGPGVLIPRPETEELTLRCIEKIRKKHYHTVFDLCAGSGCIGLSIARVCPDTEVYLFEKYDGALKYLRLNIPAQATERVYIIAADILHPPADLPQPDLIVSNPPYIPTAEIPSLQKEVQREPVTALDGGTDGLLFYRAIARNWLPLLKDDGFAAFECGEEQSDALQNLFCSFGAVSAVQDAYGVNRFIIIEK